MTKETDIMGENQNSDQLLQKQLDAEQAWEFLLSKSVPNLDINREGKDKVTLTELLSEYANGVKIGWESRFERALRCVITQTYIRQYEREPDEITIKELINWWCDCAIKPNVD